ncbi:hypothetical protein B6U66_00335 [Candidatus Bathyarchaeota archaeon ex4484_135]|nr:MAG: hypothetical protein B6U66_00335 [Candidatus Bathyarchaeota archaeon ex4484_135]
MPPRKLRIEVYDWEGTKYVLSVEGRLTREKIAFLLEMVERMGAVPEEELVLRPLPAEMTLYEKLQLVIERYFSGTWFTTRDVKEAYEQEFGEPIKLSTVSTYLARMAERGMLVRAGPASARRYRLRAEVARPLPGPY